MYCVRCGVRLREGVNICPLCGTPVWNPDQMTEEKNFPAALPVRHEESGKPAAIALTVLCVLAALIIFIACLKRYGELRWGGYALTGIALGYILFVLPRWFRNAPAEVFVPVDHAAIALFLLYTCLKSGGRWFLSFAFPVTGISCLLMTALVCLLKYARGGKLIILGGFMILLGGFTILIEFFESITFGTRMFQWSLYTVAVCGICGVFLLVSGLIPAMHQHMKKRFFY